MPPMPAMPRVRLAELTAKGYDYWALGHVHEHAVLQQSPWVVFSGNLQGRHIRETGPRGAVLVTADETGVRRGGAAAGGRAALAGCGGGCRSGPDPG